MSRPRRGEQPTAVGEAEAAAFGGTDAETPRPFGELAALAATVTTGDWWIEAGGPRVVVTAARASTRSSSARGATSGAVRVALAPGQHDLATVAHELAHALAGVGHGHDARYRRAAIDVTTVVVGPAAAAALAAALEAFGLECDERPWSAPWRVTGPGFRMGYAVANVGVNTAIG